MERRTFVDALTSAGVPKAQVYRLLPALSSIHRFDKTHRHDTFVAALTVDGRRVRAFEYEAGATEIYQAREQDDGSLKAEKLDLHLETRPVAGAVLVGEDLAGSFRAAGFDPGMLDLVEDALDGRVQLSSLHPGARLRIVAEEQTALGLFARYTDLLAIEYAPADSDAAPLRIYHYRGAKSHGYYDAKGRQPYKGGWRVPVPFARISSRFNPRRMHPVLRVIRPHNGVDFAASTGTPVYAACSGRVVFVGDGGASGNLITLQHNGAITTGYAHLSRFAPHLRPGQSVETRQLIGYVGSTGRSTGPHLHFSAKRKGAFIDPLTLRLDGERVLPKSDRAEYDERRTALDQKLDAISMPALPEALRSRARAESGEPQELEDDKP